MSIQISVTIWTVICFVLMMLILDRLLFRPMLSFMDRRREKIEGVRAARRAALQEREDALRQREEDRLNARKQAMQEASAAMEAQREENARRVAEKKQDNARRLALQQEELAGESREILESFEPWTASFASVLTEKFRTSTYRELNTSEEDATAAPYAEENPAEGGDNHN